MRIALAPNVRAIWDKSWTSPWLFPALVLYDMALGLVLILGGPERITGPTFASIRDAGGGVVVGSAVLVVGVLMGAGAFIGRRFLFVAACAGAVVMMLIAAGFLTAVLTQQLPPPGPPPACDPTMPETCVQPKAALSGIPTYLVIAYWHLANAMLYGSPGPLGPIRRTRTHPRGDLTGSVVDDGATRPDTDDAPPDARGAP